MGASLDLLQLPKKSPGWDYVSGVDLFHILIAFTQVSWPTPCCWTSPVCKWMGTSMMWWTTTRLSWVSPQISSDAGFVKLEGFCFVLLRLMDFRSRKICIIQRFVIHYWCQRRPVLCLQKYAHLSRLLLFTFWLAAWSFFTVCGTIAELPPV